MQKSATQIRILFPFIFIYVITYVMFFVDVIQTAILKLHFTETNKKKYDGKKKL